MGAGSFGAGLGGAGSDPVYVPAQVLPPTPPRALRYDAKTRTFLLNTDGTLQDVHPVDQRVALLLFVEQGTVPTIANTGSTLRARATRADPQKVPALSLDDVQKTLAPLINAGDIQLLSVQTDMSSPGRILRAVSYVNMRDPNLNPKNPKLSVTTLRPA